MIQQKIQTVSTKGQIVIPAEYRKKLGIEPHIKVVVKIEVDKNRIIMEPMEDMIEKLHGILKRKMKRTAQQIKDDIRKEEAYYEKRKFKQFTIK